MTLIDLSSCLYQITKFCNLSLNSKFVTSSRFKSEDLQSEVLPEHQHEMQPCKFSAAM